MQHEAILVLASDPRIETQMRDLSRLLIKRLSQLIRGASDSKTRAIWAFLDEARLMGRLDGLYEAMLLGRSKGLHVVLAYQDHEGWCDVYGEKVANEMANQCANVAVMRLDSEATAAYACKTHGRGRIYRRNQKPNLQAPIRGT